MTHSFATIDGAVLGASARVADVPELVEHDPFEDEITGEIMLLDLMRAELADTEVP
jgi:hypothetical protein